MLTVGTDTYITVAEACAYIAAHYSGANADRQRWEGLDETDKEVFLRNACAEIEHLPLTGRKYEIEQALAFPRCPEPIIPPGAGAAQAELALWLSDDAARAKEDKRRQLQAQGVQSFGLGDLSESYAAGRPEVPKALLCPTVKRLLSPWLNGGYATC